MLTSINSFDFIEMKIHQKLLTKNSVRVILFNVDKNFVHINGPLAQLVEQQTLNLMVGGSNPLWLTISEVLDTNLYS